MTSKILSTLFLVAALRVANAQSSSSSSGIITLTSDGCADSKGFDSCMAPVTASTTSCLNRADADGSQTEILACGCVNYIGTYNCYASHCWNKVFECDYQTYIIEYLEGCPTAKTPVPYFPIPDGAPDACSCNVGLVYTAIQGSIFTGTQCTTTVSQDLSDPEQNVQKDQGCNCCEISAALSSLYGTCPNTDPSLIGLSSIQEIETTLDTPFSSCGDYLSEFPCPSLGFPNGSYLTPSDQVPSGGDKLSNGGGVVTSPLSGAVFTYTNGGDGQVYTISAQGLGKAGSNGGSGSSGSGSGSGSGNGSGSGSESGSQTEAKTTNGGGATSTAGNSGSGPAQTGGASSSSGGSSSGGSSSSHTGAGTKNSAISSRPVLIIGAVVAVVFYAL
ncbi:hypothetical protein B7463_g6022, partial [Scytalidium lignicola]